MSKLTLAQQEALYDAERSGGAWLKPQTNDGAEFAHGYADGLAIGRALLEDSPADRCCPNGTPDRDCPACIAKFEAERQQVHARAAAADTAVQRAEILLENHEIPDGDLIFDLLMEDDIAHYAWLRCIDWVLWRQAHGKPVKALGDPDRTSAVINARFDAARALSSDIANYGPHTSDDIVRTLCAGEMIEKWERTPAQEAEIQRGDEALIRILEAIEAHFDRKRAA